MQKLIRRRVPNWLVLAVAMSAIIVLLVIQGANKPLPEYLVAATELVPGDPISDGDIESIALDLKEISGTYLTTSDQLDGLSVLNLVRPGELIPKSILTNNSKPGFTSLQFAPRLKPVTAIRSGATVEIWRVVEIEEEFEPQRLVARALVTRIISEEGLFASENAEVEISLSIADSTLLIGAISSDFDIYLLPIR
jgi:hypothetical protein